MISRQILKIIELLKLTGEITKEVIRYLILLPLIPLALGMVLFFSWAMSKASKIPEDLDEQCGNHSIT